MRLGLSSAAAPDATLDELLEACRRRGLASLELEPGHGHGVGVAVPAAGAAGRWPLDDGSCHMPFSGAVARVRAEEAGVGITGLRSRERGSDFDLAVAATAAGAPLLVADGAGLEERVDRVLAMQAPSLPVLPDLRIVLDGPVSAEAVAVAVASGFDLAWDADPCTGDVGEAARLVLEGAGSRLRSVRLAGGGPEAAMQEGRGVGALMARLALSGYGGDLILAPGSSGYRVAWQHWLGRRGGWGCGSRTAEPSLVTLHDPTEHRP